MVSQSVLSSGPLRVSVSSFLSVVAEAFKKKRKLNLCGSLEVKSPCDASGLRKNTAIKTAPAPIKARLPRVRITSLMRNRSSRHGPSRLRDPAPITSYFTESRRLPAFRRLSPITGKRKTDPRLSLDHEELAGRHGVAILLGNSPGAVDVNGVVAGRHGFAGPRPEGELYDPGGPVGAFPQRFSCSSRASSPGLR